jgi:hypothetical protein
MAIVPISLDPDSEARALMRFMLAHGDIVGTDDAGRTILQLAVDQWTLDQLCAFDAGAEDLEDADAELDPDREIDTAPVMLDAVRAKRAGLANRCLQALGLALLLVTVPHVGAQAGEAASVTLPITTAQTAVPQCCRTCKKGKPCGDGCISAERQCKKDQGCACSAGGQQ